MILNGLNQLSPFMIGYERIFNDLDNFYNDNRHNSGYPPYDMRKDGEFNFIIEIALAGFNKSDIEVIVSDSILSIKSLKENTNEDAIHKGISYRKFTRKFTLAEDIVVNSADLKDGLLTIKLERVVPEEKKPRKIKIG